MADSFGCRLWNDCESCPFPDCIADNVPSLLAATKRAEARELAEQGLAMSEISRRLGVSKRQVRRYLADMII